MSQAARFATFPAWSWRAWLVLAITLALVAGLTLVIWPTRPPGPGGFEEIRLPSRTDIPVAIATARDGTVWFTLESANAIGRLRNGQVERVPKDGESIEPLGLAVDASGNVWYTDAPKQRISRAAPDGTIASFGLSTPVARLGRLAVAPDGAVWFAEPSVTSVTRLKDGRLTGGRIEEFAVPTPHAGLTALTVAPDGAAWFTELRAHRLGRLHGSTITEFELPRPNARPFGITVDGANNVWYADLSGWVGRLHADRARLR